MATYYLETRGPDEVATLRLACNLVRKASDAAAKAYLRAGLDATDAMAQSGYAEEAEYRIGKMEEARIELGFGHRTVLLVGLEMQLVKLTDTREDAELLLVSDTAPITDRQGAVQSLALRIRKCDKPELHIDWDTAPAEEAPTPDETVKSDKLQQRRDAIAEFERRSANVFASIQRIVDGNEERLAAVEAETDAQIKAIPCTCLHTAGEHDVVTGECLVVGCGCPVFVANRVVDPPADQAPTDAEGAE